MRIIRIIGGIVSLGLGLYLLSPIAIAAWSAFAPGHEERFISVIFAGKEFTGWHVWVFGGVLAMIGVALIAIGVYVLRSRKIAA
jgi:hypothetical protein